MEVQQRETHDDTVTMEPPVVTADNGEPSASVVEAEQVERSILPSFIRNFFDQYGLAFVMVASYFGTGSIFIATEAGLGYGYSLIWAVVAAVLMGFMAQDMSGRLGIFGMGLMTFTRKKLGKPAALAIALWLSVGCVAWCLALTAAFGVGVSELLGGAIGWKPLAVVCAGLAILVGIGGYQRLERVMTALMITLMLIYVIVAGASGPDVGATIQGIIPTADAFADTSVFVVIAAILGTTALWPNFFLESILVKEKGWRTKDDVSSMRRDLGVGFAVGGICTVAIVVVAAAVLRPSGMTELATFLDPGYALAGVLGEWAMVLFIIGAIAAAFNSIAPIMWTPAYLIPRALGNEVENTDSLFKWIFAGGVGLGAFSPLLHEVTGLAVVEMIVLFPAFNGIFALPIAAILLFWAVNGKFMGDGKNDLKLNIINASLVILAFILATLSMRGFIEAVTGG